MREWHGTYPRFLLMNQEVPNTGAPLARLRTISWLFDELVRIPGTNMRVGLDALLGLLPGGGDLVGGAVSAYAIFAAAKLGAPAPVIARMTLNVGIDALFGTVPLLGDLFDASWKANRRNFDLLEQYVRQPQKVKRGSMGVVGVAILAIVFIIVGMTALSVWLIRSIVSLF